MQDGQVLHQPGSMANIVSNIPGQSFPLSLCGPNSISRANIHLVYG